MIGQVTKGYSNWKDAIVAFKKHEKSACHKEAVEMIISFACYNGTYWCTIVTAVSIGNGPQQANVIKSHFVH